MEQLAHTPCASLAAPTGAVQTECEHVGVWECHYTTCYGCAYAQLQRGARDHAAARQVLADSAIVGKQFFHV